jgi:hypothetical protein
VAAEYESAISLSSRGAQYRFMDCSPVRCPKCHSALLVSRFDATFRLTDGNEKHCFSLPGCMCRECGQLFLEPALIDELNVSAGRCTFAIESDQFVMQEGVPAGDLGADYLV